MSTHVPRSQSYFSFFASFCIGKTSDQRHLHYFDDFFYEQSIFLFFFGGGEYLKEKS